MSNIQTKAAPVTNRQSAPTARREKAQIGKGDSKARQAAREASTNQEGDLPRPAQSPRGRQRR